MPKKFEIQKKELLPPLSLKQVTNLIKFLKINADAIAELSDYESCCASDDGVVYQGYVYDALKLGYSTPEEIREYILYRWGDEDEEDEDDE